MEELFKSSLSIRFNRECLSDTPSHLNSSGLIPISMLGYVLAAVGELVHATWDYATTSVSDERFNTLRKLQNQYALRKRDIELVIVDTRTGSFEVYL